MVKKNKPGVLAPPLWAVQRYLQAFSEVILGLMCANVSFSTYFPKNAASKRRKGWTFLISGALLLTKISL